MTRLPDRIALDGVDLREIRVESYRCLLGIVEQDVFLFDGTVAENIAYGDRWATRSRVEHAARAANAAEFIERLSDGYDTVIGERGVRLSGGQRQRLAIARGTMSWPTPGSSSSMRPPATWTARANAPFSKAFEQSCCSAAPHS